MLAHSLALFYGLIPQDLAYGGALLKKLPLLDHPAIAIGVDVPNQAAYLPLLRPCLRWRGLTLLIALLALVLIVPLASPLGSQFMPPLFEGSSLYMPTALPGISITQAPQELEEQDRIIRTFPEVETVFGTVGR